MAPVDRECSPQEANSRCRAAARAGPPRGHLQEKTGNHRDGSMRHGWSAAPPASSHTHRAQLNPDAVTNTDFNTPSVLPGERVSYIRSREKQRPMII